MRLFCPLSSVQFTQSWKQRKFFYLGCFSIKKKPVNKDFSLPTKSSSPKLPSAPLNQFENKTPCGIKMKPTARNPLHESPCKSKTFKEDFMDLRQIVVVLCLICVFQDSICFWFLFSPRLVWNRGCLKWSKCSRNVVIQSYALCSHFSSNAITGQWASLIINKTCSTVSRAIWFSSPSSHCTHKGVTHAL